MICVGIDIANGKSTVCFLKPDGEVLKTPYDIEHTAEEITKLIRYIRSYEFYLCLEKQIFFTAKQAHLQKHKKLDFLRVICYNKTARRELSV